VFATERTANFPLTRAVLEMSEMYRIDRPADRWTVPAVAEALLGDQSGAPR
jgi:hypothetical protein